jgi:hypothetical protein
MDIKAGKESGVKPTLHHDPRTDPPWQWRADRPWRDEITGELTAYLAGFRTVEAARRYGEMQGYC